MTDQQGGPGLSIAGMCMPEDPLLLRFRAGLAALNTACRWASLPPSPKLPPLGRALLPTSCW
jgi:hypothetical protein